MQGAPPRAILTTILGLFLSWQLLERCPTLLTSLDQAGQRYPTCLRMLPGLQCPEQSHRIILIVGLQASACNLLYLTWTYLWLYTWIRHGSLPFT